MHKNWFRIEAGFQYYNDFILGKYNKASQLWEALWISIKRFYDIPGKI